MQLSLSVIGLPSLLTSFCGGYLQIPFLHSPQYAVIRDASVQVVRQEANPAFGGNRGALVGNLGMGRRPLIALAAGLGTQSLGLTLGIDVRLGDVFVRPRVPSSYAHHSATLSAAAGSKVVGLFLVVTARARSCTYSFWRLSCNGSMLVGTCRRHTCVS